nr:uncharacterized protein LOC109186244 [Ipomoea batatas]
MEYDDDQMLVDKLRLCCDLSLNRMKIAEAFKGDGLEFNLGWSFGPNTSEPYVTFGPKASVRGFSCFRFLFPFFLPRFLPMAASNPDRAITTVTPANPTNAPPNIPNPLIAAHHFVSIKLTNHNYLFWRTQLIPFLRGQNLLGFIDGGTPCPSPTIPAPAAEGSSTTPAIPPTENPAYHAWVQQYQSLLSMLILSLSDEVMPLAVNWLLNEL